MFAHLPGGIRGERKGVVRMERARLGLIAVLALLLSASQAYGDFEIRGDDVPFLIGARGQFIKNTDAFEWDGFDTLQNVWDFTDAVWPGGAVTTANLLPPSAAPPPAPDSFPGAEVVELDSVPGQPPTWVFETNAPLYYYGNGIAFETGGFYFIGNYQPDYKVYIYPMYLDCSWSTVWFWRYEFDPPFYLEVNESHDKYCISYGKVKVPASGEHYWPCLVIQDHYLYSDNFGSTDDRWIYEWVVPGRFSGGNGVVAVMGLSGGGANFRIVEHLFRLEEISAPGWDMRCPDFANTTVWPDTDFAGPYPVATTITDSTGVGADSLFYRIDTLLFTAVGHDSVVGDTFHFTIPQVSQSCTLDYFLWAADSFSVLNSVDIWNTDPLAAPEKEVYSFAVTVPGVEELRNDQLSMTKSQLLQNYPNPFGAVGTSISFNVERLTCNVSLKVYDLSGRLVRTLVDEPSNGPTMQPSNQVVWDGRDSSGREAAAGVYFYRLSARNPPPEDGGFSLTGRMVLIR